ncbi:MAG TPA: VOC family protein [Nannocystaceae bacterium]|nr:VOC family protein [Nannocystaceae bacterium]
MTKPQPIPEGFHTVTPSLIVAGAREAIALYQAAFGAELKNAAPGPDGKSLIHAHLKIGDSSIFLMDENPRAAKTRTNMLIYVADVDAAFARAANAGMRVITPVADMFWGDRWGVLEDVFGNEWQLATHVEDVTPEEMQRRVQAFAG